MYPSMSDFDYPMELERMERRTLRKLVDEWIIAWEKLYAKNEQTESLEMYVAKKAIEWSKKE